MPSHPKTPTGSTTAHGSSVPSAEGPSSGKNHLPRDQDNLELMQAAGLGVQSVTSSHGFEILSIVESDSTGKVTSIFDRHEGCTEAPSRLVVLPEGSSQPESSASRADEQAGGPLRDADTKPGAAKK